MKGAAEFVVVMLALLSLAITTGAWLAIAFTIFRLLTGFPS